MYLAHVEGASGFRKRLVVKQVRRELARRPDVAPLLLAEAEVVQRLAHGNIVQVLDVGVDDDAPYLVMEHVDGVSLAELARDLEQRDTHLGIAAALFVVESVAAALAHAHAARDGDDAPLGLVHRDVTPANILVSRDGVVKLTDFGIAALTTAARDVGPGFGTPATPPPSSSPAGPSTPAPMSTRSASSSASCSPTHQTPTSRARSPRVPHHRRRTIASPTSRAWPPRSSSGARVGGSRTSPRS
ncbi:protein kinase domain-containing protein [Nannocystis pusilla]|uniref:protein kinase domain-containing protein n=1 Tax=Nannocystis pusilla TaxID=889268 RepID=UPI003B7C53B6